MCTRYYMEMSPELRPIVEAALRSPLRTRMEDRLNRRIKTEGEVRPTDIAPVIAPSARTREKAVYPMVWGFSPAAGFSSNSPSNASFGKSFSKSLLLNARVETAAQKPTFREAWLRRRCIIPSSWYFEWQHYISPEGRKRTGDKYAIRPEIHEDLQQIKVNIQQLKEDDQKIKEENQKIKENIQPVKKESVHGQLTVPENYPSKLTLLAGLYRIEDGIPHFVVLTREPSEELRLIHDRMPLILPESAVSDWINPDTSPEIIRSIARNSLTKMSIEKA